MKIYKTFLIILLILCGRNIYSQSTPQEFFENGLAAFYDARFQDGINYFTTYIKTVTSDPRGYNYRGLCYQAMKDYPRSIEDFTNAISVAPNAPEGYLYRGNSFVFNGDFPSAMLDYDNALRLNPKELEAYFGKGRAYIAQRKFDDALRAVNAAQGLDPTNARCYVNLAWVHFYLNDTANMFDDISTAIYYDSTIVFSDYRRDLLYVKVEVYKGAMAAINEQIAMFPTSYLDYFTRGVIYFLINNFPLATEDLDTSIKLNKNKDDPKFNRAIEQIKRSIKINS